MTARLNERVRVWLIVLAVTGPGIVTAVLLTLLYYRSTLR